MYRPIAKPFVFTIFGASGDLAKLKLFPAIYALAEQNLLPEHFVVVGFARSPSTHEDFRKQFAQSISAALEKKRSPSPGILKRLLERIFYFSGQYDRREDFFAYRRFLADLVGKGGVSWCHVAYFSVPPFVFQPILENLGESRKRPDEDLRIVLEKPFGDDEISAQRLFHFISRYYNEDQIYLLDHYLGKTAVQSILSLRHANGILNTLLKGKEIASIQISALENFGVADRVGYFDQVGIIKDMFQSHLTQILAMLTMSIPITETAESFQREKYAILSALKFSPKTENIFLGQYQGYRRLEGVPKNSRTETFMSAKIKIDRESWYGIPIFIRTGKKLNITATYAVIEFKRTPFQKHLEPNRLIFELKPNERLEFRLLNRHGETTEYHNIIPAESIACRGGECLPEHATLLLDILKKEKLHFLSFAEIIAAWRITDSILHFVKRAQLPVVLYPDGSATPKGSLRIFRKPDEKWFEL